MGLILQKRLRCGVQRPKKHSEIPIEVDGFAIWPIFPCLFTDSYQNIAVHRLTIEVPCSCVNTHSCSPALAPLPDEILAANFRLFIDRNSIDFSPGVRSKWDLLCAHRDLGMNATIPEKAGGHSR